MPPVAAPHAPPESRAGVVARPVALRRALRGWYARHGRDLPWRRTDDPYAIWLSESMLQQTQVATVIPYYERFLARYPTVHDLAAASIDEVLRQWSGLGYYARARNLHTAAREIVNRYEGRLPDTVTALRALPGIGRYTAGAVASIAFGRRAAAVDGNVARVLSRVFHIGLDIKTPRGLGAVWAAAEALLPHRGVGDFNQALIELGATVCLPGQAARCSVCPLRGHCAAFRCGNVAALPVKTQRGAVVSETHVVVAIESRGHYLFRRRPAAGLWGGLWELPSAVCAAGESAAEARRLLGAIAGNEGRLLSARVAAVEHQLTHRLIRFETFMARVPAARARMIARSAGDACERVEAEQDGAPVGARRWMRLDDLDQIGISSAVRRIVTAIRAGDSRAR